MLFVYRSFDQGGARRTSPFAPVLTAALAGLVLASLLAAGLALFLVTAPILALATLAARGRARRWWKDFGPRRGPPRDPRVIDADYRVLDP